MLKEQAMNSSIQKSFQQYGSIVSQAKEQRAKKEAGGTSFGAQILAQSAAGLGLATQAEKSLQTSPRISSESAVAPRNSLADSITKVKFQSNVYGYSMDSEGFMGEDFNKAAGLPSNFKIHKKSLNEFIRHATKDNNLNGFLFANVTGKLFGNNVFDDIDIANTIGQYYNIFSQVMGDNLNKDYFTDSDLLNLPKGYSSKGMETFNIRGDLTEKRNINFLNDRSEEKVTNIYRNNFEEASKLKNDLKEVGVDFNLHQLDFSPNSLRTNYSRNAWGFNPDMSVYQNSNGYTKEALFMSFLKSENPMILEGGTTKVKDSVLANNITIAAQTAEFRNFREELEKVEKIMQSEEALKRTIKEHLRYKAMELEDKKISKISSDLFDRFTQIYRDTKIKNSL